MTPCRLLLTGFPPFAGLRNNPSADVVHRLRRDPRLLGGGRVRTAILPVDGRRALPRLARLLREHSPVVLLMTGLARSRREACLELRARNEYRPLGRSQARPIAPSGPADLRATLPLRRSLAALRRHHPVARTSEDAGTYTCNLVLHEALRWRREGLPGGGRWRGAAGFVHLPAARGSGGDGASPPLEELLAAVRELVLELARKPLRCAGIRAD